VSKFKAADAAKISEDSLQQHREANYRDDFDAGRQHVKIRLEKIDPNPYQPRIQFDDIEKLADSISEDGLLQPISVRQVGDRFQLIAGERRLHAHRKLGKPTIEAIVISVDDAKSAVLALAENIARQDLTDFEVSEGIRKIASKFATKTDFAKSLNLHRQELQRYEAFSKLPEVMRAWLMRKPGLLGRSAADDIEKALRNLDPSPALTARIEEALSLLEKGKLDQAKFTSFIQGSKVATRGQRTRPTYLKNRAGARVGSFSAGSDEVVVKIASSALHADQLEKLQQFVVKLLG
jgi:ParB family transcriptional regulator, chromosome partitioning protein